MEFTQEDNDWLKRVQEMDYKYKIVIDNDAIWVETLGEDNECVYTFSSYGYEFIYGLLHDMGINAKIC